MPADQIMLPRRTRAIPTRTRLVTRRVPVSLYVVVLLVLPVLVVTGSMAAGWWSSSGRKLASATGTGQGQGSGAGTGQGQGSSAGIPVASPADIRGSTTIHQVVEAFPPVTTAEICSVFGVTGNTSDTVKLKTLIEEGNGTGLPQLRDWLEQRLVRD